MKLEISQPLSTEYKEILSPEAINFLYTLYREHETNRRYLINERHKTQAFFDNGVMPTFLRDQKIRNSDWSVLPVPSNISDRRVEITGPTDRKMIINALNSGASVFMADFEDSNSPTWNNLVQGQINLRDAVNKTISFTNEQGKKYALSDKTATLFVRPRGLHLLEKHVTDIGIPISGSLFDFGLYFFHNARKLLDSGSGPYFYLPKLQNHLEARWWNNVFEHAQDMLNIPKGTIKATMLIEHILAAFETEEMLYELKDHSAGLNCGRWDYIFSYIKTFRNRTDRILPDRSLITMSVPFMSSYCQEVIRSCHKRGAHAMGGMSAQIPIKNDPQANEIALNKVAEDKQREFLLGHDGTWVAHPGLIPTALSAFSSMGSNQIHKKIDKTITAEDLTAPFDGNITDHGFKWNVLVGIQYLDAWLQGNGCVPLYNLMEDAATSEICRTQIWQWIRHKQRTESRDINISYLSEVIEQISKELDPKQVNSKTFKSASQLFLQLSSDDILKPFLTQPAYDILLTGE